MKKNSLPDQTIALMDEAARANRADPFVSGFLVELPAEGEVMVTGDVHGHYGHLRRIVKLANLARHRQRHLVLQELVHELSGSDEVCRSYRLVETAARLKVLFPSQVHALLGNHELSELLDLEIGRKGRELNVAFDEGGRVAYGDRWDEVKSAYRRFWESSPLAVRTQNRIFISHSTPRLKKMGDLCPDYLRHAPPGEVFDCESPAYAMLWGRDYSAEAAEEFARRMDVDVLVVGHTRCDDGLLVPNGRHVVVDCKDFEGRYLLLPLDRPLAQQEVVSHARRLYG